MLKTRPSSARRTALLGVSAVVLALGSSALARFPGIGSDSFGQSVVPGAFAGCDLVNFK